MQLNLLGSGGVAAPPKPCCNCRICREARDKGIPFARTGASLYIYDAGLLIDTPEEIRQQLNRERINNVKNIIISHWHPDHTLGLRVIEAINYDTLHEKPFGEPIGVYIAPEQFELMKRYTAGNVLTYFESKGIVKILPLPPGFDLRMPFGVGLSSPVFNSLLSGPGIHKGAGAAVKVSLPGN